MQGLNCFFKLLVEGVDLLLEVRFQVVDLSEVSLFFGVVIPEAFLKVVVALVSVYCLL